VRAAAVLDAIAAAPPPRPLDASLLDAVRDLAASSRYGNAFLPVIERRLSRRVSLAELIALGRAGVVAINRPTRDYALRPLDPPRAGAAPPLDHLVRERFDWLTPSGDDLLRALVEEQAQQGEVRLGDRGGRLTIEVLIASRPGATF